MLGLFATLNMGTRSLQTQQTGVEIAGQNLANINNPAYARQRVQIETSTAVQTYFGYQGTGADVATVRQIRDAMLDNQVQGEASVGGYWGAQQTALQYTQAGLGEYIDSTGTVTSVDGTTRGLADGLSGLFNAFQSVATSPASMTDRQLLLSQAQSLASRFNQTATGLNSIRNSLNTSLDGNVTDTNTLLSSIAALNQQIVGAEGGTNGTANDLRDLREQKLEELAKYVDFQSSTGASGSVDVTVGGTQLISGSQVLDTLQTYDAGGGQMLIRTAAGAVVVVLLVTTTAVRAALESSSLGMPTIPACPRLL